MRRLATAAAVLLSLAAAQGAAAGDGQLQVGGSAETWYDDNVFGSSTEEQSDFYLRTGPMFKAFDQQGHLQWDVFWNPTYLKYARFGELDGWDQNANGKLSWVPSESTRVYASALYVESNTFLLLSDVDPTLGDTGTELTRQGVERSIFELGGEHRFARRHSTKLSFQRYENDYELATRSDVTTWEGQLDYLYDVSQRTQAGVNFRYTRQEFADSLRGDQITDYYNVSLTLQHYFDPSLYLSFTAGPAYVDPQPVDDSFTTTVARFPRLQGPFGPGNVLIDTCPTVGDTPVLFVSCVTTFDFGQFDPAFRESTEVGVLETDLGDDATDITYFVNLSITKRWTQHVRTSLYYVRDTSTSDQFGGSSVRDLVYANAQWNVTRRFTADFEVSFQSFEAASKGVQFALGLKPFPTVIGAIGESAGVVPVLVESLREERIYRAQLRLGYQVTPRTRASLTVVWQRQQTELPPAPRIQSDRVLVVVGVTYFFRPIQLGF